MKALKRLTIPVLIIVISGLIIQSCMKDHFELDKLSKEVKWEPSFAIPLAYGRVSVYDALRQFDSTDLIQQTEEGMIYLKYYEEVASIKGNEILSFPNQTFPDLFTGTEAIAQGFDGNGNLNLSHPNNTDAFVISGDERLDSIRLTGNTRLNIYVDHSFDHNVTVQVTFPEMKKSGQPWTASLQVGPGLDNTQNYDNLNNYSLELSNMSTDTNMVLYQTDLSIEDSGGTLNTTDYCVVTISFANIDYYSLYGYLGYHEIEIPLDSVHIDLFDTEFDGAVYFKNPQLKIFTNNSFGLPVQFSFSQIQAYSKIYNQNVDIIGTNIPMTGLSGSNAPIILGYPDVSQAGESILDSIVLSGGDSNLDQIVSSLPKYIYFDADAIANPTSEQVNTNFILDTSTFDVGLEVILPLWGNARYFKIGDTVEVDMSEVVDSNHLVDLLVFRMVVENGFPFEFKVQGTFTDSLYNPIDVLVTDDMPEYIIESGITDGEGRVDQLTGTTTTISDFVFPEERISKLKDVRYVIFDARAWTTHFSNSENIRIYSDYKMALFLGLKLDIDVSSYDDISFDYLNN